MNKNQPEHSSWISWPLNMGQFVPKRRYRIIHKSADLSMERINVTKSCGFKPLEFASYYSSEHGVIKSCKHLISIDIHVSIVPTLDGVCTHSSGEAISRPENAFIAVDLSRLTPRQARVICLMFR
jgi:hypothetical protein